MSVLDQSTMSKLSSTHRRGQVFILLSRLLVVFCSVLIFICGHQFICEATDAISCHLHTCLLKDDNSKICLEVRFLLNICRRRQCFDCFSERLMGVRVDCATNDYFQPNAINQIDYRLCTKGYRMHCVNMYVLLFDSEFIAVRSKRI